MTGKIHLLAKYWSMPSDLQHWWYLGINQQSDFVIVVVAYKVFVNFGENSLTLIRVASDICEHLGQSVRGGNILCTGYHKI